MKRIVAAVMTAALAVGLASPSYAVDFLGLEEGTPELKHAGALAFGPHGVLFVGDAKSATVFAIGTGDKDEAKKKQAVNLDNVNAKIADALSVAPGEVTLNDLAVNPLSGNIYLSATTSGDKAGPALLKIAGGQVHPISLKGVPFAKAELANPPKDAVVRRGRRSSNPRMSSITDLAFVDGRVLVSGLSGSDAPSTVRAFEFPFGKNAHQSQLTIYHAAHGRSEDYAPIQTFAPFTIDGKPHLLAGFVCTPLVKFPLGEVAKGKDIKGTTIAELGNRNRPYDMIVYKQGGEHYLLMANSARGVMKISTKDIERDKGLTERVSGGGTAGQSYETIEGWDDVVQLDKLDESHAVVVLKSGALKTVELP